MIAGGSRTNVKKYHRHHRLRRSLLRSPGSGRTIVFANTDGGLTTNATSGVFDSNLRSGGDYFTFSNGPSGAGGIILNANLTISGGDTIGSLGNSPLVNSNTALLDSLGTLSSDVAPAVTTNGDSPPGQNVINVNTIDPSSWCRSARASSGPTSPSEQA